MAGWNLSMYTLAAIHIRPCYDGGEVDRLVLVKMDDMLAALHVHTPLQPNCWDISPILK
jgi:hypothetical protein